MFLASRTVKSVLLTFNRGWRKKMKKALITGITGQDGSYLAELLLDKGYEVHGTIRRVAIEDPEHRLWRLRHILDRPILHAASLESFASIFNVVNTVQPDEIYHLAAQSFVSYSFEDEFSTISTNIDGTHYMLAAVRKECRMLNSILPRPAKCSGMRKKPRKTKTPAFTPDPRTVFPKSPDSS